MDNYMIVRRDSELYHHGIKGMKWGIRRYQKKDGSLTLQGKIHYGSESRKLAKAKEKLKEEKKAASTYKKNKAKLDKLEADKQKVAEQRKALKDKKSDKPEETAEQKKARLLKSTDAKEIYKDKDVLTDQELQNRVNRIDLEARLSSKIPEEKKFIDKAIEKMDTASKTINSATEVFNKIDRAYSSVANSTLAKAVGIDLPTSTKEKIKEFNLDDFYANMHKMSTKEREAGVKIAQDMNKIKTIKDRFDKEKKEAEEAAAKEAKYAEAKKQVDDYNERWKKDGADDKVTNADSTYRQTGDSEKVATGRKSKIDTPLLENVEKVSGTVEGKGTSKSSIKEEWDAVKSKKSTKRTYTDDDIIDMVNNNNSSVSNVPAVFTQNGRVIVTALLEELK